MINLPKILPTPSRPSHLQTSSKWLSGEGAGSWFVVEERENSSQYKITRFSPEGKIECDGIFSADKKLNLQKDFYVTYPSHCAKVTIVQESERIHFEKV